MAPSLPKKKYLHEDHPDLRPTVFQQEANSLQQLICRPLPQSLLNPKPSSWSDSDPGSNSKNPNSQFYIERPKAIKEKFIYDPENGGGRKRRDKRQPRWKIYTENMDKLGSQDILDFNARIGLNAQESDSPLKGKEKS